MAYYAEKQRAALYDFDEETLRPYFPLEKVVAGMFDLVHRLYGIRVTEVEGVPAWDEQVAYYNVHDENDQFLGAFYADWYPRENKRGGAWMDALITGGPTDGGFQPHLGLICGNLSKPIGGRPALLTHRDVETIFHEFGHLLHHLLSRVRVRSLAGTSVAWDFVELPSQIMENWCWERESLDLFARHWETGEPVPEDLFKKMKRARTFRAANAQMRQLGFGFVDLELHTRYSPGRDGDPVAYARKVWHVLTGDDRCLGDCLVNCFARAATRNPIPCILADWHLHDPQFSDAMPNCLNDNFAVLLPWRVIVWENDHPLPLEALGVILQPLARVIAGAAGIAGCNETEVLQAFDILLPSTINTCRRPRLWAADTTPG